MGKASEASWYGKIAEFKRQQNISLSECSSFLLDILQGLYEDISEKIKIELLLILQEYGEGLIQGQESAEQAVGSIKSILKDLLNRNHDKHYVTHCLVTTTTLIIQFDLFQFNPLLVQEITQIVLNICKRVNIPGETLIRKVASECLIELETAIPLILSKNAYLLFDLAKKEKSYMSQNYMLLVSIVVQNALQLDDDNKMSVILEGEIAFDRVLPHDAQQMMSYIAGELNHMSPTILWQAGQIISHLFTLLDMPEVVLQNKMIECCYSSNLQLLHLGLLLGLEILQGTVTLQELLVIAECLLNKVMLPTFPNGIRAMCLEWLLEALQQIDFMTDEAGLLISDTCVKLKKQLALDSPSLMQAKLEMLSRVLIMYPKAFDYFHCLEILLKIAYQGIIGPQLSILFRAFYLRFSQSRDSAMKSKIKDHIVQMTLKSPALIGHTIDLIRSINSDDSDVIRQDLIHQIASFILKLPTSSFFADSSKFFPLVELACSEKGLWPLGVIKWMKSFCLKSAICRSGDWEFGSNMLSACRAILANHSAVQLLHEMADLLWFIHKKFNDQDIKDKALFIYLIIGHASPKYFEKLFGRSNSDSKNQSFSRKNDIEVPAELVRGILPTICLDKAFLIFEKSVVHKMKKKCDQLRFTYNNYESYMTMLKERFDTSVNLNLKIMFASDVSSENQPTKVYALSIKFNQNTKCRVIPQIHLPFLFKSGLKGNGCLGECVSLQIEPCEAVPFNIEPCCTFTNSDGRICVAPVPPIKLTFSDFFHPLAKFSEKAADSERRHLFQSLWDHCKQNKKTSKSSSGSCVTCVKRLIIRDTNIKKVMKKEWKPFVIEENDNASNIGIFLSPKYHLLMTLSISADQTLVRFCIDNWELLDVVENYLEGVVSKNR